MKIIIHDLKNIDFTFNKNDIVINARNYLNNCIGCFSCWIKHPTRCIYDDQLNNLVTKLKDAKELVIISQNRYGCYSSHVKKVLERVIGYVLPYFTIRDGMIHQKLRYSQKLYLLVIFYDNIPENDRKCIKKLVKANAINLGITNYRISFINDLKEL